MAKGKLSNVNSMLHKIVLFIAYLCLLLSLCLADLVTLDRSWLGSLLDGMLYAGLFLGVVSLLIERKSWLAAKVVLIAIYAFIFVVTVVASIEPISSWIHER